MNYEKDENIIKPIFDSITEKIRKIIRDSHEVDNLKVHVKKGVITSIIKDPLERKGIYHIYHKRILHIRENTGEELNSFEIYIPHDFKLHRYSENDIMLRHNENSFKITEENIMLVMEDLINNHQQ